MPGAPGSMDDLETKAKVVEILRSCPDSLPCLEAVKALDLPDAWIGAGFVRNRVWDRLHGYSYWTALNDIDVVYFDLSDISRAKENELEAELARTTSGYPWSVRNQARMHLLGGFPPFRNSTDAITHWVETATAIAVRLDGEGKIELLAPHGLRDLFQLYIAPTPAYKNRLDVLKKRASTKRWQSLWPKLRFQNFQST